ncbi:MAG: MBL fold metallo-hydrolase [Acidobacteriota bacterium]|jgi:phosphoribosyl 1,2-cyclic phosphodiesterase|nr:MBL fold metallo-hydrolase [Acidobacteriota bacterium]
MRFTVLGSGSTGNSVLICTEKTKVLVDVGLSAKETLRRLALVGVHFSDLDAILITHEHSDHAGGLRVLLGTVACPVYVSGETQEAYLREKSNKSNNEPQKRLEALKNRRVEIESSRDFRIGDIDFEPFTVPHDAADNFGFVAKSDGVKVATILDFGCFTTLIREKLRGCDGIVIESNHCRDMLKTCAVYSWDLKQRIMSRTGHISNEDLSEWLTNEFDGTARHVVLAHLSQRANEPHLARLTAQTALQMRAPLFKAETQITISYHREPTVWIEF